jgi:flavodoxin
MSNKILVTYVSCTGSTRGVVETIEKSLSEGGGETWMFCPCMKSKSWHYIRQ